MKHSYLLLPIMAFIISTMIIGMQLRAARIRGDELSRGEIWQVIFAVVLAGVATAFAFFVVKVHMSA